MMESSLHKSIFERCSAEVSDFCVQCSFVLRFPDLPSEVSLHVDHYYFRYVTRDPVSLARDISSREIMLAFDDSGYLDPVKNALSRIWESFKRLNKPHDIVFSSYLIDTKKSVFRRLPDILLFTCANTLELSLPDM